MQTQIFANYLKVAFRFLNKEKSISIFSILGLILTLVSTSFIYQYVTFEESFDEWNPNKDQVYRVHMNNYTNDTNIQSLATTFSAVGPYAMESIPEVDDYVRLFGFSFELNHNVMSVLKDSVKRDWFNGDNVFISTPSFFKFFPRKAIYGNLSLEEKSTVVISKSIADRYYPNENPVGQIIQSDFLGYLKIAGVFDDFPSTSHLQVKMLLPWDKISADDDNNWRSLYNTYNYLKINDQTQVKKVEEKLDQLYMDNQTDRYKAENTVFKFQLQSVNELHLGSIDLFREFTKKGNPNVIAALKLIGIILLVIGIINYLNLMISRSKERLKEIGIRKILGGGSKIFAQFFTEGLIIITISIGCSVLIVGLFVTQFNYYLELDPRYSILDHKPYWVFLLLSGLVIPVLAGGYPALAFRKMQVVTALKGKHGDIRFNISLRRALTTFQFMATIFLIFISFVIFRQLDGMQSQKLGFSPEQVIVFPTYQTSEDSSITMKYNHLTDRLSSSTIIHSATVGSSVPGYVIRQSLDFRPALTAMEGKTPMQSIRVDENFFKTFNIDLLAGRGFDPEFSKVDYKKFNMVINETAARALGYQNPKDAVGNYMYIGKDGKCQIIGVVKDFNQQSLHHEIKPVTFYTRSMNRNRFFSVRLNTEETQSAIDLVQTNWEEVFPDQPFDYFFLDGYYSRQYKQDHMLKNIMSIFTALILFVSSIGLLGMITLVINQRTKEFGIRKILGASQNDFFNLLGKEYLYIIGVALAIGWPISYWASNNWLERYAWRVELNWVYGLVPLLLILTISLMVMSLRIRRISRINPTEVLRDE